MHISDDVKGTSPDRLTGTDVMVAIGTTSSRARFGMAAFFGKAGISKTDEQLAVQALARYAMDVAPKNVRKAAGGQFGWCMQILAQFAFADYSRSAATSVTCHSCSGTGRTTREQIIRKVSYPWGKAPYWACRSRAVRPSDWEQWTEVKEVVPAVCDACEGKGTISARCRCGGKGEVLDRKATKERGAPVFKTCERCSGNGFCYLLGNGTPCHSEASPRTSINPHGHATGNPSMKCWWTLCAGSVTQQWNLRRRQLINMIGENSDTFCTLVLTLHKTVLYAFHRGILRLHDIKPASARVFISSKVFLQCVCYVVFFNRGSVDERR